MTEKQINHAIAEACGICHVAKNVPMYKTSQGWVVDCPDYCEDLNAMHEAEKVLTYEQCAFFRTHLRERIEDHAASLFVWHATARQRAEAFLRAIGKWQATDKESLTVQSTTEKFSADREEAQG